MALLIKFSEFAAIMARLGPFEKNPMLAVAVSGGRDSMALLHLAHDWARGQGGRVIAFTVDHNIRAASAAETVQVAQWCAGLGIEHVSLTWDHPEADAAALQQRARSARHDLLENAAASRGILHLLIAHHLDDQAETVLLRLAKGSGPDGLAAMAPITYRSHLRILRPLLDMPRERLTATCEAYGQQWIDDPSNQSERFARPRLRAVSNALAGEGLTAQNLGLTAASSGRARAALERATAAVLAAHARILPQGYAEITLHGWHAVDPELKRRALGQLLHMIGGGDYPPNAASLEEILARPQQRTSLAGCLIDPAKDRLLLIRETRNIQQSQMVDYNTLMQWDRFAVLSSQPCLVDILGDNLPASHASILSKTILATQPGFYQDGVLRAVPTIGYFADPATQGQFQARFCPKFAAGPADFAIV